MKLTLKQHRNIANGIDRIKDACNRCNVYLKPMFKDSPKYYFWTIEGSVYSSIKKP